MSVFITMVCKYLLSSLLNAHSLYYNDTNHNNSTEDSFPFGMQHIMSTITVTVTTIIQYIRVHILQYQR